MRKTIKSFTEHIYFQNFIIGLLIFNAIVMGLETARSFPKDMHDVLWLIDHICIAIFATEVVLRIVADGWGFFRRGWNIFDFVVTGIALLPLAGAFVGLRTLRILRILRLFSAVPTLRRVVNAILLAVPGISSVVVVMMIIFYVFAVIATNVFAEAFPEYFGDLGSSMFTLFQVMTLESWSSQIARPVLEQFPHAWLFFIMFILSTTFIILNMFIAVLISSMQGSDNTRHRAGDPDGFDPTTLRKIKM